MTNNVNNYFAHPAVPGGKDNVLNIDGTWKIGGTAVTVSADQLNSIDSIQTVANKSGSPMVAGALVYISGYDTTLDAPIVLLADADDATKKATLVLTAAIANNASGTAEAEATITGLNTSAYSAVGSLVYESATAGASTPTAPTPADDDRRVVGVIKVKDASDGEIFYFPGKGGLEHAAVYLNNLTPGTASASGALVVDASKDISGINDIGVVNLDAGSSGVAGSVDIFPTTATSGKTSITSTDNSGDTTTLINIAAQSGARTITIPDGGQATANILLSEGAQIIAGVQTYSAPQVIDSNTGITAFATGGQGSAVALTGEYNNVDTVATNFDSVKLLAAVAGQIQTIKNSGATILSVFPNSSDSINALAINLSIDIPVGGEITFRAIDDTIWETQESLYSSAPSTQSGGLEIKASDNAGNTDVTITNASHGQATTVTIPDSGIATSYIAQSTAALTVAEVDVLDDATAGTQVASKVVIADANINTGVSKVTELHIGATGAEVQVTSTPAELNLNDISVQTETIDSGVAASVTSRITHIDNTSSGAGAITLAAPDATMEGIIKVIEMTVDAGDVTLALTNVQGGSAASTCTWANVGEQLVLVAGVSKWSVIGEGGVILS